MKRNIFYSWQSDLPNNTNRSFIEDCLNRALKDIKNEEVHLDVVLDRDTKEITGTPDIVSSIFSKIDVCDIFIADISFINPQSQGRKTPNPNVLIELGYAARTIGWKNIICVFNTDYGKIEDLPFDLRFRRPLTYSIEDPTNKSRDRSFLTKTLRTGINSILREESSKDEIRNYIKQQVDKEILTICNHLYKILHGYDINYTLEEIWKMLSLKGDEIDHILFERQHLGFTVLKDWKEYMSRIENIMNQPFFNQNAESKYITSLIKVIRCLEMMVTIYQHKDLFALTEKKETKYKVVDGTKMNPENPKDGYLLLKKLETEGKRRVIDFGIIRPYNIDLALNYVTISGDNYINWSGCIKELFESIEVWVEATGNYLIIDPLTFRI